MKLNRRTFLITLGAALLSRPILAEDWEAETPLVASIRQTLEAEFAGRKMALDFRRINPQNDEDFRVQINAADLYPVASCFKAFVALYYYYYTLPEAWQDGEGTPLYSAVVFSNNLETGTVIADVERRARGGKNAIEKFNDFLLKIGMENGIRTWDWPGSPTIGFFDERFAPSASRFVRGGDGTAYNVDNAFTAADLARGYDVLVRGAAFTTDDRLRTAIAATNELLAIRNPDYRSPIEFVFPDGYIGKDGILPVGDIAIGRVVDDAGVLAVGDARYIVAFMSAGESESRARNALQLVVDQINLYEQSL